MEGLFAYPCRRVATPAYPLGAKIRKNRPRCSPRGGFLCSFNTITPKSPYSKPFPIPFASVLGVGVGDKHWHYLHVFTGSTPLIINMADIQTHLGMDAQGLWIVGYGANATNPGRQTLFFLNTEDDVCSAVSPKASAWDENITSMTINNSNLTFTFSNDWMTIGLRKL